VHERGVQCVVDSRAVDRVSAVEMQRRVVVRAPEMLADWRFHSTADAPSPRLSSVQAHTHHVHHHHHRHDDPLQQLSVFIGNLVYEAIPPAERHCRWAAC